MVHEQGETIDSIEANVDTASITVHDGTEQLRQAERYKVRHQKLLVFTPHIIFILNFYFFCFILFYHIIIFQNKARKKKVCLAITGIVILAIIIGIIVWQVKKD